MVEANLGRLFYEITANDLTKAGTASAKGNFAEMGLAIGGALSVAGVAIDGFTSKYDGLMKKISTASLTSGMSESDLKNIAINLSNAENSVSDVSDTLAQLSQAGVKSSESMEKNAEAADKLGVITDTTGQTVVSNLVPALQAYNLTADDMADHTDTVTDVLKHTQLGLGEYTTLMQRAGPAAKDLGYNFEDMSGIIETLSNKGETNRQITSNMNKALTAYDDAIKNGKDGRQAFLDVLGLTNEDVDKQPAHFQAARGELDNYTGALEAHESTLEKVGHYWDVASTEAGGYLQPLKDIGGVLSAVGPMITGISGMKILWDSIFGGAKGAAKKAAEEAVATEVEEMAVGEAAMTAEAAIEGESCAVAFAATGTEAGAGFDTAAGAAMAAGDAGLTTTGAAAGGVAGAGFLAGLAGAVTIGAILGILGMKFDDAMKQFAKDHGLTQSMVDANSQTNGVPNGLQGGVSSVIEAGLLKLVGGGSSTSGGYSGGTLAGTLQGPQSSGGGNVFAGIANSAGLPVSGTGTYKNKYGVVVSGDMSNYAGFAEGGMVKATPGGVPIIAGEGGEDEYIIPKSKLGGGSSTPVEVHVYIDSTKIIKALAPGMGNIRRITTGAR